jgi:hypothetical protein
MVEAKYECSVCKKGIVEDGMKCPATKEKFHKKCIAKHLKNCKAPHIRLRTWGRRKK